MCSALIKGVWEMSNGKRQIIGPRKTLKELQALVEKDQPESSAQAPQTPDNPFQYAYHLDGSWGNAEWASDPNHTIPGVENNPYFDRDGYRQNQSLKRLISEALIACKKIDPNDPHGSPWLLSWRMYPNKDHPRWKQDDCCGCNCGCVAPWEPEKKGEEYK